MEPNKDLALSNILQVPCVTILFFDLTSLLSFIKYAKVVIVRNNARHQLLHFYVHAGNVGACRYVEAVKAM